MCLKTRRKLGALRATVGEDLVAADDGSIHLVYEKQGRKASGVRAQGSGDDLRVFLKEAQELLRGRKVLSFKNAASGLIDPRSTKGTKR